jgi:dipicolinate synthase subunit A
MSDLSEVSMEKYSYIFNTVPALILTENLLDGFSDNVMIFDIASAPGGTDFAYCRQRGIYAVNSLGIPGKEYPREAGEIIARAILQDLN